MNILRGIFAALAVVLLPSLLAAAPAYPDKPIRVIVPVPAGGTPDVVIRTVAPGVSGLLGQQLVIGRIGDDDGLRLGHQRRRGVLRRGGVPRGR